MNGDSDQSKIKNTNSDWKTTIYENLGVVLPLISSAFLIIYDDFIDTILGMVVFGLFAAIIYETDLRRRVSKVILWLGISGVTLWLTNSNYFYSRSSFKDIREQMAVLKAETLQNAGVWGVRFLT